MNRKLLNVAIATGAIVAAAGTAFAVDYDPTGQAGRYQVARVSALAGGSGGSFQSMVVYVPVILDEDDGQFNSPAVQDIGGFPFGAWTTFSSAATSPPVRVVGAFGWTDASNPGSGSNDVFLSEGPTGASNSIGTLLADGTLVYRANFSTAGNQNNLEVRSLTWPQTTPGASITNNSPNRVFDRFAPGIDNTPGGTAQLGTPGAARFGGTLFTGVAGFSAATGAIPDGVNVYAGLDNNPAAPLASWLQSAVVLPTLPGPAPAVTEARQTQPGMQVVNLPNGSQALYTIFGVGFSPSASGAPYSSGAARPVYFIVDEVTPGNFSDGFAFIEADNNGSLDFTDPDFRFVDHQATGGGTGPFVTRQFDMNSKGQVVALRENRGVAPRVFDVLLFNPVFSTAGDRITGYSAPTVIASTGQNGIVDELQSVTGTAPNQTPIFLTPISGVAIDEAGRVAFVGVTEKFEQDLGGGLVRLQNSTNSVFVWEPCTQSLHTVLKGGQNGDILTALAGPSLQLGVFPVDQASDGFNGAAFSDVGGHLVVTFRNNSDEGGADRDNDGLIDRGGSLNPGQPNDVSVRGIAVVTLGDFTRSCPGDANGDGVVNFSDLNAVLSNFGATGSAIVCLDTNGDGVINFADLNAVLSAFGQSCP